MFAPPSFLPSFIYLLLLFFRMKDPQRTSTLLAQWSSSRQRKTLGVDTCLAIASYLCHYALQSHLLAVINTLTTELIALWQLCFSKGVWIFQEKSPRGKLYYYVHAVAIFFFTDSDFKRDRSATIHPLLQLTLTENNEQNPIFFIIYLKKVKNVLESSWKHQQCLL